MRRLNIAVVGSGVSGLAAAWMLSKRHLVTLYESETRVGGHANTFFAPTPGGVVPVDTGFIVYNEATYPNFTQLLRWLDVASMESDMGFSVSLDGGRREYSGRNALHLLGSWRNAFDPSHWAMLRELHRFYTSAKVQVEQVKDDLPLQGFLAHFGYRDTFVQKHLLPMASAIWSCPPRQILSYPARAFISFFDNHQLLNLGVRQNWRTVAGGSQNYVRKLAAQVTATRCGVAVKKVVREPGGVDIILVDGSKNKHEHVVLACHADQALHLLATPSDSEITTLSPFSYSSNRAVLHEDENFMPKSKRFWSSWNYLGNRQDEAVSVTYWMNRLQNLETRRNFLVSVNPPMTPARETVHIDLTYRHPVFTTTTLQAQQELWSLQGRQNTWFCGAYFGSGFHEDGLQAGLAVAEDLGGLARPWQIESSSSRIWRKGLVPALPTLQAAG